MKNQVSSFIKKKIVGKNQNLASLDEPFRIMARLLKGRQVTGIIDAGASHGRISKRLLRKFPKAHVYAFEPNSLHFDSLEQYARENSMFHPYFLALSDCEGEADLHITEPSGRTSLLMSKEAFKGEICVKRSEKVQLVTIDNWAKLNGEPEIQLMKFDIQGGELKALRGARYVLQHTTLLVYTEIWFNCPYEGGAIYSEIDLFLRKYGFALYDIYKPKYNPNGPIRWANAIFLNLQKVSL